MEAPEAKLRELSAPFSYIDPEGIHWDVPAGYQTDGATIPMFFRARDRGAVDGQVHQGCGSA